MGKGKRLKQQRLARVPQPGCLSPGELATDEQELLELLQRMPANHLPYLGLAAVYLASSPVRNANQCLMASTLLMLAMRNFGITADLVALEVEAPDGSVRYGTETPRFEGDTLKGHVGLIADSTFIDATASQFREIRATNGVRPISGPLGEHASQIRTEGGRVGIQLAEGKVVTYNIHRIGSADGVGAKFMRMQPDGALAHAVQNLITTFIAMVANVRPNDPTGFPSLDQLIRNAQGMDTRNDHGVLRLVPRRA